EARLEGNLPKRRAFLEQAGKYDGIAKQIWPDMFKQDTELAKFANAALATHPFLEELSYGLVVVGKLWEGEQAMKARMAAAGDGKAKPDGKPKLPQAGKKPKGAKRRKARPYSAASDSRPSARAASLESYVES